MAGTVTFQDKLLFSSSSSPAVKHSGVTRSRQASGRRKRTAKENRGIPRHGSTTRTTPRSFQTVFHVPDNADLRLHAIHHMAHERLPYKDSFTRQLEEERAAVRRDVPTMKTVFHLPDNHDLRLQAAQEVVDMHEVDPVVLEQQELEAQKKRALKPFHTLCPRVDARTLRQRAAQQREHPPYTGVACTEYVPRDDDSRHPSRRRRPRFKLHFGKLSNLQSVGNGVQQTLIETEERAIRQAQNASAYDTTMPLSVRKFFGGADVEAQNEEVVGNIRARLLKMSRREMRRHMREAAQRSRDAREKQKDARPSTAPADLFLRYFAPADSLSLRAASAKAVAQAPKAAGQSKDKSYSPHTRPSTREPSAHGRRQAWSGASSARERQSDSTTAQQNPRRASSARKRGQLKCTRKAKRSGRHPKRGFVIAVGRARGKESLSHTPVAQDLLLESDVIYKFNREVVAQSARALFTPVPSARGVRVFPATARRPRQH